LSACDKPCTPCVPDCTGKDCGADSCGGSCGTCSGSETCDIWIGQCYDPGGGGGGGGGGGNACTDCLSTCSGLPSGCCTGCGCLCKDECGGCF
jgi:hypothetical protein